MTSATLMLGGDFNAIATSVGLKPTERDRRRRPATLAAPRRRRASDAPAVGRSRRRLAVRLRASRRSSTSPATSHHPAATGSASASSTRSPRWSTRPRAARSGCSAHAARPRPRPRRVRERLPHLTTLAQGDAQLPELARQFVGDPHTCLFGTLSLWQGLDVPGETCQLVLIDRIPFPRPDDPLMSARQRAADREGHNGFMQVAATHAALLLAQGTGRLIRTTTDRGVVAVLDPRLATARYGAFLRASLPPMWTTYDGDLVRQALTRLAKAELPAS